MWSISRLCSGPPAAAPSAKPPLTSPAAANEPRACEM
jgi:hypothetical protein